MGIKGMLKGKTVIKALAKEIFMNINAVKLRNVRLNGCYFAAAMDINGAMALSKVNKRDSGGANGSDIGNVFDILENGHKSCFAAFDLGFINNISFGQSCLGVLGADIVIYHNANGAQLSNTIALINSG